MKLNKINKKCNTQSQENAYEIQNNHYQCRSFKDKLFATYDRKYIKRCSLQQFQNQPKQNTQILNNSSLLFTQNNYSTVKNINQLLKRLQDLIKQLCLTKSSIIQVQQKLGKIAAYFKDTIQVNSNYNRIHYESKQMKPQYSAMSVFKSNDSKEKSIYQNISIKDSYNQSQLNGLQSFFKYFTGTIYEQQSSLSQYKLNSYQAQLLQQYFDNYMILLQKLMNRISKYNGQKKLKYLLQTVMKQIFVCIMRFSYQTKIQMFKRERKNILSFKQVKAQVFTQTLSRIFFYNSYLQYSFKQLRKNALYQADSDNKFVNRFEIKINFLDNQLKINQRKQLRSKFLQWRRSSIISKKTQEQEISYSIQSMIKQILLQFAHNSYTAKYWKVIIWIKVNQLIKKICKFGETALIPLFRNQDQFNLFRQNSLTANQCNTKTRDQYSAESQTYRYSVDSSQEYRNKDLFQQIKEIFSQDELRTCFQKGQIFIDNKNDKNIMLIPIKSLTGILAIKYLKREYKTCQNIKITNHQLNINNFHTILTALQKTSGILVELMQLTHKFQYFENSLQQKRYHNFFLSYALQPKHNIFNLINASKAKRMQFNNSSCLYSKCIVSLSPNSCTNRSIQTSKQRRTQNVNLSDFDRQISNRLMVINQIFNRFKINNIDLYHKNQCQILKCLKYNVQESSFNSQEVIGKNIVKLIFNKLQKTFNQKIKKDQHHVTFKSNKNTIIALPLIHKQSIIGFIQITIENEGQQDMYNTMNKCINQYKYVNQMQYQICKNAQNNESLNQSIFFTRQCLIPLLLQIKRQIQSFQVKNQYRNNKNVNRMQNCQYCKKIAVSKESSQLLTSSPEKLINQNQSNSPVQNKSFFKISESLTLQDSINFILKYGQRNLSDETLLKMQKQAYQLIDSKVKFSNERSQQLSKKAQNNCKLISPFIQSPQQTNSISLINKQYVMNLLGQERFYRICYFNHLKSKDNKTIILQTQEKSLKSNQQLIYFINQKQNSESQLNNLMNQKDAIKGQHIRRQYLKLPNFIDQLQLFQTNKSEQIRNFKLLQIPITKVVQIYKQLIQKKETLKKNNRSTLKDSINNQNCMQNFVQNILKSHCLKNSIQNQQNTYDGLQLLLYQLECLNKQDLQIKINLSIYVTPIFTKIDNNRYLSGLICNGGFQGKLSGSQAQCINDNENQTLGLQTNVQIFKLVKYISSQIMSKILQIKIRRQIESNANLLKKDMRISIEDSVLSLNQIIQKPHEFQLNVLKDKQMSLYQTGIQRTQQLIKNILVIQNLLQVKRQIKLKNVIKNCFHLNLNNKKQETIQRMFKVIQNKLISQKNNSSIKNTGILPRQTNETTQIMAGDKQVYHVHTRLELWKSFIMKMNQYVNVKQQHYLKYSNKLVQTINHVLVINKLQKRAFQRISNLLIDTQLFNEDKYRGRSTNKQHNQTKLNSNNKQNQITKITKTTNLICIKKKCSIQRIINLLNKIVFDKTSSAKEHTKIVRQAFQKVQSQSKLKQIYYQHSKKHSIYKFFASLKRIISKNSYLPYFKQLQALQSNLYQSISLIGTQIQSIKFYSIFEFLKFINQRVNIIIKSQKRLIDILYGNTIQKINLYLMIQSQNKNSKLNVMLSQKQSEKIISSQQQSISNQQNIKKVLIQQKEDHQIFIVFQLIKPENTQNLNQNNFKDLILIIKKVMSEQILKSFQRFWTLYSNKIKTFCFKLNKCLKLKYDHLKGKNIKEDVQIIFMKYYTLKKLKNNFFKTIKFQKAKQLNKQIQRKTKQLQQLQNVYQENANALSLKIKQPSKQIKSEITISSQQQQNRINQEIISKNLIKQKKRLLQSLDMSCETLSIQYQIKSKTVSGYQIMEILKKQQQRSAILSVGQQLMLMSKCVNNIQNGKQFVFNDKQNKQNIKSNGNDKGSNNQLIKPTDNLYVYEKSLIQKKQKLNNLKEFYQQQKSMFNIKIKLKSVHLINRLLKNICKNSSKKAFSSIHSAVKYQQKEPVYFR